MHLADPRLNILNVMFRYIFLFNNSVTILTENVFHCLYFIIIPSLIFILICKYRLLLCHVNAQNDNVCLSRLCSSLQAVCNDSYYCMTVAILN